MPPTDVKIGKSDFRRGEREREREWFVPLDRRVQIHARPPEKNGDTQFIINVLSTIIKIIIFQINLRARDY